MTAAVAVAVDDMDEERSGDLLLVQAFLAHRLEIWPYEFS